MIEDRRFEERRACVARRTADDWREVGAVAARSGEDFAEAWASESAIAVAAVAAVARAAMWEGFEQATRDIIEARATDAQLVMAAVAAELEALAELASDVGRDDHASVLSSLAMLQRTAGTMLDESIDAEVARD